MDILSGKGHRPGFAAPYTAEDLVTLWSNQQHPDLTKSTDTLVNNNNEDIEKSELYKELKSEEDEKMVPWRWLTPFAMSTATLINFTNSMQTSEEEKQILKIARGRGASFLSQMWRAHNRSIIQQYRRVNAYVMEVVVAVVTGILMGMAVYSYDGALYQGLLVEPYILISPIEVTIPMMSMVVGCAIGLAGGTSFPFYHDDKEMVIDE